MHTYGVTLRLFRSRIRLHIYGQTISVLRVRHNTILNSFFRNLLLLYFVHVPRIVEVLFSGFFLCLFALALICATSCACYKMPRCCTLYAPKRKIFFRYYIRLSLIATNLDLQRVFAILLL